MGFSPWDLKESDMTLHTRMHARTHTHTHTHTHPHSVERRGGWERPRASTTRRLTH